MEEEVMGVDMVVEVMVAEVMVEVVMEVEVMVVVVMEVEVMEEELVVVLQLLSRDLPVPATLGE